MTDHETTIIKSLNLGGYRAYCICGSSAYRMSRLEAERWEAEHLAMFGASVIRELS